MSAPESSGTKHDLFGDIAVAKGLLTWSQVRDVLKKQMKYRQKGILIRVGELAIEMGYLTAPQITEIIVEQRLRRPSHDVRHAPPKTDLHDWDASSDQPYILGHYELQK